MMDTTAIERIFTEHLRKGTLPACEETRRAEAELADLKADSKRLDALLAFAAKHGTDQEVIGLYDRDEIDEWIATDAAMEATNGHDSD